MDHKELLDAITQRLDEKIDLIREDLRGVVTTQKDHEVRLVKVEAQSGFIRTALVTTLGGVASLLGYLAYKLIDNWSQKG